MRSSGGRDSGERGSERAVICGGLQGGGVVDGEFRVTRVEGVRVVQSSVIPEMAREGWADDVAAHDR